MARKRRKIRIELKIDNLLGNVRLQTPRTGGSMSVKKGKGSYDRKKKNWKKEYDL